MRAGRMAAIFVTLGLGLGGCSSGGPQNLRDSTAATLIQNYLDGYDVIVANLGVVEFRRGNVSSGTFDRYAMYPMYQSLAAMGLIRLEDERDLASGFTGWGDFLALSQNGVQRVATVTLTPQGERTGTVRNVQNSDRRFVVFVGGNYTVDDVVSNDEISANADKYRVILATCRLQVKLGWDDVWAKRGRPAYQDRRTRILLKYDAFQQSWQPTGIFDIGPRDAAFESEDVPAALARLRSTGSPYSR